jgi:hypothetical protein
MRMVTLTLDGATVRVPEADTYPGYSGWTVSASQDWPTLAMLQQVAWAQVKAIRAEKLLLAPTPFGTAQSDIESMVKINGLVSMAMLAKQSAAAYSEVFTLADNSEVTLSADQMIGFGVAVGQHIAAVHARGRELRAAIDAAADQAALAAIDVTTGWP